MELNRGHEQEFGWCNTTDGIYPSGATPAPKEMLKAARTTCSSYSTSNPLCGGSPGGSVVRGDEGFSPQGSCFPSSGGPRRLAALPTPT